MRPGLGRVEGGRGEEREGLRGGREICWTNGWIRDAEGKQANSNYTSASLAVFHNHWFLSKDYPSFQPLSADATSESVLAETLSQKFGPVRFIRRLRDFVWAGFASNAAALNAAAAGRIQVGGNNYQGGHRVVYDLCAFHWC